MKNLILLFIAQFTLLTCSNAQQQLSPEARAKMHEFDFWLGEWTVYNYGTENIAGYSHITSVVDSVGLEENYTVPGGTYSGTSLNKYNFNKERWEQYYIDNSGLTLHLVGGIEDGKMVLGNKQEGPNGTTINRITWTPMPDGSVRQTWHQRPSQNDEWTVAFDGHYKPKN